jgi:hypothetical protein
VLYGLPTSFERGGEAMDLMDNALRAPQVDSHGSTRRIINMARYKEWM